MSDHQQDVLATAVNYRLDDLYVAACVPYLSTLDFKPFLGRDPLTVLDELLGATSPDEETDP